jgi:hypothetical protein
MALVIVLAGFAVFHRGSAAAHPANDAVTSISTPAPLAVDHSSVSGLGEFLRRWEMNNLLFSILYENIRPHQANGLRPEPWYTVVPADARERLRTGLTRLADAVGSNPPQARLSFLLTQALRFWFVYHFPDPTLPGDLTGRRFFDEVVVWIEHLPVLLILAWSSLRHRFTRAARTRSDTGLDRA